MHLIPRFDYAKGARILGQLLHDFTEALRDTGLPHHCMQLLTAECAELEQPLPFHAHTLAGNYITHMWRG